MTIMICISQLGFFVRPGFSYQAHATYGGQHQRTHVLRLWRTQITWEHRR